MNTTINQLLTNVYELEGLLLVMQRHHDNIPQLVIEKFKEKASEIAAAASIIDSIKTPAETPAPQVMPPTFVPPAQPEPALVAEKEEVSEPVPEPTPIPEPRPVVNAEGPVAPHQSQPAVDITSAFSINDRFLFQRELFDGNKEKYDDAIAVMQRLADIDKIKEFMTDVLALDRSNEVVKEFIRLIEQSFKD